MKPVIFLAPASQEMFEAAWYYEQQVSGLGDIFLDKIDSAVQDIAEQPERWPIIHPNIRHRLILRFPYALYYRIDQREIVILAVAHLHRHPTYWIDRC